MTLSDEVFFHTIISMFGMNNEIRPALFWTEFDPRTNHPFIWTLDDLPLILEKSPFMVRKVSEDVNARVIDSLEDIVMGRRA